VNPDRLAKGPNGRALCRWCQQEVPKGRSTFCSNECVHEHKIRTNPGYVRQLLFKRDRGVCAVCGLDTVQEEQRLALEINAATRPDGDRLDWIPAQKRFADKMGTKFTARRHGGFWDADHIVPVVEDGGECGLDNYRTLCIPCHKAETKALRARLSKTKKET
jgi:5-methylcytosine-specific restriction endonuclease McrA